MSCELKLLYLLLKQHIETEREGEGERGKDRGEERGEFKFVYNNKTASHRLQFYSKNDNVFHCMLLEHSEIRWHFWSILLILHTIFLIRTHFIPPNHSVTINKCIATTKL